jgi:hypothetical protein
MAIATPTPISSLGVASDNQAIIVNLHDGNCPARMRGVFCGQAFRFHREPMTLGNMRELGVRSLDVSC